MESKRRFEKNTSTHRSTVPGQKGPGHKRPGASGILFGNRSQDLRINPRIPGYKTGDRPGSVDRIKRTAAVVVGHLFESLYTTTKVLTLGQSLEFRTLTTMPYVGSRRSPTTMFYKPEPELDTP